MQDGEVRTPLKRILDGLSDGVAILGVDVREIAREAGREVVGADSEQLKEVIRPRHAVGDDVPFPATEADEAFYLR